MIMYSLLEATLMQWYEFTPLLQPNRSAIGRDPEKKASQHVCIPDLVKCKKLTALFSLSISFVYFKQVVSWKLLH